MDPGDGPEALALIRNEPVSGARITFETADALRDAQECNP